MRLTKVVGTRGEVLKNHERLRSPNFGRDCLLYKLIEDRYKKSDIYTILAIVRERYRHPCFDNIDFPEDLQTDELLDDEYDLYEHLEPPTNHVDSTTHENRPIDSSEDDESKTIKAKTKKAAPKKAGKRAISVSDDNEEEERDQKKKRSRRKIKQSDTEEEPNGDAEPLIKKRKGGTRGSRPLYVVS